MVVVVSFAASAAGQHSCSIGIAAFGILHFPLEVATKTLPWQLQSHGGFVAGVGAVVLAGAVLAGAGAVVSFAVLVALVTF
jgi:hypothetical protein